MASIVLMLSSFSLTLPVPSEPAFFMHSTILEETSTSVGYNTRVTESDHSKSETLPLSANSEDSAELHPRLTSFIDCQPTYNKHLCLSPVNERASNTYTSNLDSLLISLSSKASVNSFYNDSSNGIYSLFLCRGDVSATTCQTCVNNATQLIRQRCPTRKHAIIWYDECMLQYSNVSFFGRAETSTALMMWNIRNTTSPDGQNYGALALIYSLIDEAPYTDMMFGTVEKVVANGNQHGYALVQCTRDINSSSCRACLGRLTEQIQNCCQNRRGWRILSFSCYLRYEEYLFYQQSMAPVSPVPVMPQPMPNDGGKGGSNTTKIVIITVSSTLAAVGGAILGFWYYSSSCRMQRPIGA
ncbi:hypothetical protein Q3G72_025965 [Acer saccharum]|nr:hypothetical protein Q3G72_025965 [Acer saccharum]